MAERDQCRTDATSTGKGHAPAAPSPWVARFLQALPHRGSLLDIACGGGRHSRFALSLGFTVTAVDRTLDGVADLDGLDGVTLVRSDLECGGPWPFAGHTFDVVVVTNYLWRPIFPHIVACVARNGLLAYETFALGNERYGSPRNPDFLLAPGELVARTQPALVPIAYDHATLSEPSRLVARIAAVGLEHVWLNDPPRAQF